MVKRILATLRSECGLHALIELLRRNQEATTSNLIKIYSEDLTDFDWQFLEIFCTNCTSLCR